MPDTNPRKLPQLRVVESIEPNRVIETAHPTNYIDATWRRLARVCTGKRRIASIYDSLAQLVEQLAFRPQGSIPFSIW